MKASLRPVAEKTALGEESSVLDAFLRPTQVQCHPYVPASGCVRVEVLKAFLRGKWIPAKETLPPRALHDLELPLPPHHYHRHTASTIGHLFEPADSDEYILNDFLLYLLTRPEKAVPPPVRELLLPKAFRHSWPGDVPGRDSFKPPRKDCGLREKDSCHLLAMQYQPCARLAPVDLSIPRMAQRMSGLGEKVAVLL
eukprot:gene21688-26083_t